MKEVENIENLAITLFLKTLRKAPALISAEEVRLLVDAAQRFAKGEISIQYEPTVNTIVCREEKIE